MPSQLEALVQHPVNAYPPTLAMDVAIGTYSLEDLCIRYDVDRQHLSAIMQYPAFMADVARINAEIGKQGGSFRVKAKALAEQYLATTFAMINDPTTPAAVRADLIKQTVIWADLVPKTNAAPTGNGFQINITVTAPALAKGQTIDLGSADVQSIADGD